MRRELVLLVPIVVGGCLPDQTKAVAACRVEADRFYQGYGAADVDNPRSRYVIACMAAKGYNFDVSPADCDSRHALATQSTCYASQNWMASIINQFRAAPITSK
jgi:hypothetical protein